MDLHHDETDVPAALERETADGPGWEEGATLPESDYKPEEQ